MLIIIWSLLGILLVGLSVALFRQIRRHTQAKKVFHDLKLQNKQLAEIARDSVVAIKEANQRTIWYRNLFRSSNDIALVYAIADDNMPGTIVEVNDRACKILEYSAEELAELTLLDLETIDETYLQQAAFQKNDPEVLTNTVHLGRDSSLATRATQWTIRRIIQKNNIDYEGSYISKSGKRIPVSIRAHLIEREEKQFIACTARDLTGEHAVDLELQKSRQRYNDFITNSPLGVAIYDGQKNLIDVNVSCLKMFGCPSQTEFERFNIFDNPFLPLHVQRDIKRGGSIRFEMALDFDAAIKEGLLASNNQGRFFFNLIVTNLGLDEDFNTRGFLVQIQNITRQRETEDILRQRERQLRQAQKLEAIGALAGGIAHDFNNILTPILGYAELGMDICVNNQKLRQFFQEILSSSRRAKDLVSQILTFSRRTDKTKHPIKLTPIIEEVIKHVATVFPDNIKISKTLKTEEDQVMANPIQVHQILMNLCMNAMHVMKNKGGEMEVQLTGFILTRHHRKEFPQLVTADYLINEDCTRYIRISIRDTGCGMDTETLERIFEPFFTTKQSGEGTGMGLAVVHGIVISMGGAISVESEAGKGSTFHVVLPVIDIPQKNTESPIVLPVKNSLLCILFVDDETGILKMADLMLKSLGYEPVMTNRSKEALRIFEQQPNRFDLVITDQVMPEMTGSEMAGRMIARRPDLPILLCTGFSESLTPAQALAVGIREILMKPIQKQDMAEAIHRVIRDPGLPVLPDGEIRDGGQAAEANAKATITV